MFFQLLDVDYYNTFNRPIIRLYGLTIEGKSVLVHVEGFRPYFYTDVWPGFQPNQLRVALGEERILSVEIVRKKSIYGYRAEPTTMLKVTCCVPTVVTACRDAVTNGISIGQRIVSLQTYDSALQFNLRYMIDHNLQGGCWVEITDFQSHRKTSRCQLEIKTRTTNVIGHNTPEPKWNRLAPWRVLSFDIECAGQKGHFPTAESDPVIQIANVLCQSDVPIAQVVFCLGTCSPVSEAQVFTFEHESDLLLSWHRFLAESDPDFITGYNTDGFDFPYLLKRAETLGIEQFGYFGRILNEKSKIRVNKQKNNRTTNEIGMRGRVHLDMLPFARGSMKMRSWTLNAVATELLVSQAWGNVFRCILAQT